MNLNLKKLLSLVLMLSTGLAYADCTSAGGTSCSDTPLPISLEDTDCTPQTLNNLAYGQTFFSIRPQYSNTARDQMGTSSRNHKFASSEFNGDASLGLDFAQSTNCDDLGTWFFFNGTNTMTYGPNWNANANTNSVDVNSLNFAVTASGNITANPRIINFVADFQLYLGWDEFVQGLWTRMCIPVNYVRTDMRLIDNVTTADANAYAPGYFNQGDVDNVAPSPIPNPTSGTIPPYTDLQKGWVGKLPAGDFAARAFGNIDGRRSHTSVAGLVFDLGYDFLRRERGHVGMSLRIVAPTGNEPNSKYVFEPISGANGCWEIGAGFTSAYQLYTTSTDSSFNLYVDGQVTHLGSRSQKRMFGLQNLRSVATAGSVAGAAIPSAGASWILLEQFSSSNQYTGKLASAADKLALVVKVGNAVMADFSGSIEFRKNNYGVRAGYNFWMRTKDKASARQASVFATENWGIKAASDNNGTANLLDAGNAASQFVATKSESNIAQAGSTVASGTANYLTEDDITVCPALHPSARSNKVFGSVDYTWSDNEWTPYLLIGGSYEIGASVHDIKNSALNQWSLLAKGGIAF